MTTPHVHHRMELAFELPGTPEQVWEAIATANGISSWMIPTDLEEREGGAICFHMGDTDSPGTITGWDPPVRLVYEEPDWGALAGHADDPVTPLVSEFLVEARSGGTCVVRVVTSGFGTGADWEGEFFADMEKYWAPCFDTLRLYLTHFPGQRVTTLGAEHTSPGEPAGVWSAMCGSLGISEAGQPVDARGVVGHVERIGDDQALLQLNEPVPGLLVLQATGGDGSTTSRVWGYLFSDDAAEYVEREAPSWQAWLESLSAATAHR